VNDIVNRLRPISPHSRLRVFALVRRRFAWAAACPRARTISRCTGRTPQQLYAKRRTRAHRGAPARLAGCTSDLQIKTPRVNIVLDRDRAAALHLNWKQFPDTLYDAFGPQFASTSIRPTNQYRVLLECCPNSSSTPTVWT
jgi:HAE1 family hydrophobic/amphiphilic exporter-1